MVSPAGEMATDGQEGSLGFLKAVMGLHMNALAALVLVVCLLVICLVVAERLKRAMPRWLQKKPETPRSLAVLDVVALDPKRRLTSVVVHAPSGKKALAVILTGGPSDVCIGWLDHEDEHAPSCEQGDDDGPEHVPEKDSSHA